MTLRICEKDAVGELVGRRLPSPEAAQIPVLVPGRIGFAVSVRMFPALKKHIERLWPSTRKRYRDVEAL